MPTNIMLRRMITENPEKSACLMRMDQMVTWTRDAKEKPVIYSVKI